MIQANSISFEYPGVLALDNVSLSAGKGDIVALVGPNGAGKTTLLRCLAALERPISGSISINGTDTGADPRRCFRSLGYLRDLFGLYDDLTARQCLLYAAAARGMEESKLNKAVERASELLQLTAYMGAKAGTLSRGLRQRLAIAQTIVHDPQVILLDEPASGLDPEARGSLSKLFRNLAASGKTLVVSSHILTELEEYSTSMLVINRGRMVSSERVSGEKTSSVLIEVSLARPYDGAGSVIAAIEGITEVQTSGATIVFKCAPGNEVRHAVLSALVKAGAPVCGLSEVKADMQASYLKSLGSARRG